MERKRNSRVTKQRTSEAETPLGVGDAQLAYEKWEAAGKPPGDGSEFWLQAEKELVDRN